MTQPTVSIVMTYYERRRQLCNTLRSFELHGYKDLEVIIVDDGSEKEPLKESLFAHLPFRLQVLRMSEKKRYLNPCVPFNVGIRAASGDIIILQSAECLHVGNIVEHARRHISGGDYLTYACYSLGRQKTERLIVQDQRWTLDGLDALVTAEQTATFDGDDAWYNHSVYRPYAFHFCSAILKENMDRLGGFDERFAKGIAFDDNELLVRIRRLGLNVAIVDDTIVLHQWHYAAEKPRDFKVRFARNAVLFHLVTEREKHCLPSRRSPRYLGVAVLMPFLVLGYLARERLLQGRRGPRS